MNNNETTPLREAELIRLAEQRFPITDDMTENEKYIVYSRRNGFCIGASLQSQSLPEEPKEKYCRDCKGSGYIPAGINTTNTMECPECDGKGKALPEPEGEKSKRSMKEDFIYWLEGVLTYSIDDGLREQLETKLEMLSQQSLQPEGKDRVDDWKRLYQNLISILSEVINDHLESGDITKAKWTLDTIVKNGNQILTTTK